MKPKKNSSQTDVRVNGNVDGNIIVGNGNQVNLSKVSTQINTEVVNFQNNQLSWDYLHTLTGHWDGVNRVVFSPNGQILASSSLYDTRILIWSVKDGKLISIINAAGVGTLNDIAFSYNGEILAAGCEDKKLRLYAVGTGKLVDCLEGHSDEVWRTTFSKDGRRLASASTDCTIRLYRTSNNELINEIKFQSKSRKLAFYPNNSRFQHILISAEGYGYVQMWGTEDGKLIKTLDGHFPFDVFDITLSADDNFLAVAGYNEVHLWYLPDTKYLGSIFTSQAFIWSVAFDPNRLVLAIGHENGAVEMYNTQNRTSLKILRGHNNRVWSVAFTNDGQFFASGSEDKTIRVWRCSPP